jgi:hypothetical protein
MSRTKEYRKNNKSIEEEMSLKKQPMTKKQVTKKQKISDQDKVVIKRQKVMIRVETILTSIIKVKETKKKPKQLQSYLHISDLDLTGIFKPLVDFFMGQGYFKQEKMKMAEEYCISFGIHAGKTLKEINSMNPGYLKWMIDNTKRDFVLYGKKYSESQKMARIIVESGSCISRIEYSVREAYERIDVEFFEFFKTAEAYFPTLYQKLLSIARAKIKHVTQEKKLVQMKHMEFIYYHQLHNLPLITHLGENLGTPEIKNTCHIEFPKRGEYTFALGNRDFLQFNLILDHPNDVFNLWPSFFYLPCEPSLGLKIFLQLEKCFVQVYPFFILIMEYWREEFPENDYTTSIRKRFIDLSKTNKKIVPKKKQKKSSDSEYEFDESD